MDGVALIITNWINAVKIEAVRLENQEVESVWVRNNTEHSILEGSQ